MSSRTDAFNTGPSPSSSRSPSAPPVGSRGTSRTGARMQPLAFAWKSLLGTLFCTNPITSFLVVGWTHRTVRRRVLAHWWRQSPVRARGISLEDALTMTPAEPMEGTGSLVRNQSLGRWPNWILGPSAGASVDRTWRRFPRAMFGSLVKNARIGAQAIFNTWLLTLPGCALWLFAWFAGWNNSFHKGYELAFVGPTAGLFGAALFVAAMSHVPLAQVRHAVSERRQHFFDFRLVRKLNRENWLGATVLAGLYALVAVPFMVAFALPAFFPQISPALGELSPVDARAFLQKYFFWVSLFGFAAFVFLRLVAARVYASAVLGSLNRGFITPDELSESESQVLSKLELLDAPPRPENHVLLRLAGWTGTRLARAAATITVTFFWFTFVAQIFVREFFNYHPVIGWMNQALVQLPFFSLIPPGLGG